LQHTPAEKVDLQVKEDQKKGVKLNPLAARVRAEKEVQEKREPNLSPSAKEAGMEYVAKRQFERDVELQKRLNEPVQTFLDKNKLKLPGYGEVKEHSVTLPLKPNEEKWYLNKVAQHYNEQLGALANISDFNKYSRTQQEAMVKKATTKAKKDAKMELEKAIESGSNFELDNGKKKRFSIKD